MDNTTTFHDGNATLTYGGHLSKRCPDELLGHYQNLIDEQRLSWTEHHRFLRLLGSGGQGVVYLTERRGTDGFTLPGRDEDLFARSATKTSGATTRRWPGWHKSRPALPRFSTTICSTCIISSIATVSA